MFLPQEDLATKFKNNKFKINQNTFLELHVPLKNNSILKLEQLNLKKHAVRFLKILGII